ncbi:MAG: hypothetical protein R3E01_31860 [Pirellulaceae bacterium]|nr:hypothetical protein [Planctomycetales bacterium]
MDTNPYAPPADLNLAPDMLSSAESIRQAHIKHEASIKSVGTLYLLGAILILVACGAATYAMMSDVDLTTSPDAIAAMIMGVIYLSLAGLQIAAAIGLWKLKSWARWVSVVISALGLLAFPIGTLINGYILYLLLSQKGNVVFSAEYKRVIEATPHVKYRTSKIVIAFLIFLVLLFVLIFGVAIIGSVIGAPTAI